MGALFASGAIVDLILAGVALEALAIVLLRGRIGPGLRALLVNLASGAALMLALRAALTGSDWPAVAGWMLAGLAAHLADLALRLRGGAGAATDRNTRRGGRGRFAAGLAEPAPEPRTTRDVPAR